MIAALIISSLIIQLACIAIFGYRQSSSLRHEQLVLPLSMNQPIRNRVDSVDFWSRDSLPRGRTRLYGAHVPVAPFQAQSRAMVLTEQNPPSHVRPILGGRCSVNAAFSPTTEHPPSSGDYGVAGRTLPTSSPS
jgi:hypothetical protein